MSGRPSRLVSVDLLRGVIMVVMALDHVRDYVHYQVDPMDLGSTTIPLYATRWITHLCAPVFMLLAGASAYLQLKRGKSRGELARFLVTRGLWLVVLEVTVIRCAGWFFNVDYRFTALIVIWALGVAMIALAALLWLPQKALLAICVTAIAGHNLLDGYAPDGALGGLWSLLHQPGVLFAGGGKLVFVGYPLIPWVFVMALGFACGPVLDWEPARRRRALVIAGGAMIAAFVILRGLTALGDPRPFAAQDDAVRSVMAFLACEKYPPSLCYLLMTLGPSLLLLAAFEHWRGRAAEVLLVFGRVPMFYYLLHLPLIHGVALGLSLTRYEEIGFMFSSPFLGGMPGGYGYPLWATYLVWIGVVWALYVPCRWFAAYKRDHRAWWLSYL